MAGGDLGEGTRLAAVTGAWICFEDEAGRSLRPPRARTWAPPRPDPRGHGVRQGIGAAVGGRAGLPTARPRGRLFYRVRVHRGRKGERRSMSEADYAELVTAAHHQLRPRSS